MPAIVVSLALLALGLGVLPLAEPIRWLALVPLLAFAGWLTQRRGWGLRPRALLVVLLPLLLLWGQVHRVHPGPDDPSRLVEGTSPTVLEGRLVADARPLSVGEGCQAVLMEAGGATELRFPSCADLRQGWRVRVIGELRRPATGPHPLLSSAAERLARQGIWSQMNVAKLEVLERPPTPVADLRRRMATALIKAGGPEKGGVLAALVLGSAVVPVPIAVREAFRVAGLSHALAASGFHLTVLLGAVMVLGRRSPRAIRWTMAGGAMLLFLLLAGPQPSVVRAVLMGAVAFVVLESGQRGRPLGVLLLTLLAMLLVQPLWLLDVGFQLSVAATAGLMLTARDLETALAARLQPLGSAPWARKVAVGLAAGLAVPLAASLWTLPLQLLHFGSVPLWAVPSNVVVSPLLTPLTLGAMAMALVAVLAPPLLGLLAWPLVPLTGLLLATTRWFAALPMAQWQLGRPSPLLVLLLSLGLLPVLVASLGRWRQGRTWGVALIALACVVHLGLIGGDRLLLVHQGSGDLLIATHQGRGALVSTRGDGLSCSRARQLALGLGLQRFDWLLVSDPVAPAEPACWQALSTLALSFGGEALPLGPGQRIESPGLTLAPLAADGAALRLQVGAHRWVLLPDRQALWSWRSVSEARGQERLAGLWLGFRPRRSERAWLQALAPSRLWLSGRPPSGPEGLPGGWRASGASGFLQGEAG
ncbi:ComEC/Rec2 family competence protein [Cyanobium sp. Morenito 9A2]|uniref:ComEC/Rec2 family competence protein n=1 Tax=Cyanobium sp. Morenito 9A2 TaxID=2823718 RepID=UPI0020CDCCC9|nr:ComEC/Rec2 family competence protein [Cyanobium sp. Morenito 9A2]MCP9851013.1 ComEC/Rec2 family competence protein [Cyanobium sp. Morenito 9A2]